jgi:hypothetical protein
MIGTQLGYLSTKEGYTTDKLQLGYYSMEEE